MKRWMAALLAVLFLPMPALAQAPAAPIRYGVLSLVSDSYSVVTYHRSVGSLTDANLKEVMALPERVFDHVALVAINETLQGSVDPGEIAYLAAGAATLYPDPALLFDGRRFVPPAWLAQALEKQNVPRLILVTKHKSDATIAILGQSLGSGKLEGLGFYIDRFTELRRASNGDIAKGFMAPFAYLRISLIDVPTMTVVRQQVSNDHVLIAPLDAQAGGDPWESVTPAQKLEALERLVKNAVSSVLPQLLSGPPPVGDVGTRR